MSHEVLITGASGLIGSKLTKMLLQKHYQVCHLGRAAKKGVMPTFVWNPQRGELDERALEGVTTIIHLAGAGIADQRWTTQRKKEILESRTKSTQLLFQTLNTRKHRVKTFISASAIGYYGFEDNDHLYQEDDPAGSDFLADVVKRWEYEVDEIERLAIRCVKVRIGIVLSKEGGALPEIVRPIRWGIGAPLGTGAQNMSWIHEADLCRIFLEAIENSDWSGPYNAVAPGPVTNRQFTEAAAAQLKKRLWLPPIPEFVIRLLVGEMAALVLKGSKISSKRIEQQGFTFTFPSLPEALHDLLSKKSVV